MDNIPADIRTKISTEAAESFVESYYLAVRSSRATLASFYVPKTELPDGKTIPSIVLNGAVLDDGITVQKFFIEEMPFTQCEPQSVDCHVLNPKLKPLESNRKAEAERNMSLLVSVSGWMRSHEHGRGPMRGFSETFVLVPNEEYLKGKAPRKDKKSWLIQSQNFRYVT